MNPTLNSPLDFIAEHKVAIFFASAIMCFIFFLVSYLLYRRNSVLNKEMWVKLFARLFLVLSLIHLCYVIELYVARSPEDFSFLGMVLIPCLSGITNYYCLRTSVHLLDKTEKLTQFLESYIRVFNFRGEKRWRHFRYLILLLLIIFSLILSFNVFTAFIDHFVSTLTLCFLGYSFYVVFTPRRDFLIAKIGYYSAITYGFSFIIYALLSIFPNTEGLKIIIIASSLIWKTGIFITGFSLMLTISSQIEGITKILDGITDERKGFWDKDGVVKEICSELNVNIIELYIIKPDLKEQEIILYKYIEYTNNLERKLIPISENKDYGFVIKNNVTFFHNVIGYGNTINDNNGNANFEIDHLKNSIICTPIIFNNAIIGCLKAILTNGNLTQADVKTLIAFAKIFAPQIRSYQEIEALNSLSVELTKLRTESAQPNIQSVCDKVIEAVHNKITPLNSLIHIHGGFRRYLSFDSRSEGEAHKILNIFNFTSSMTIENKTWEAQKLNAFSDALPGENQHTFGRLLVAFRLKKDDPFHPTFASDPDYRAVVASQITDTILDCFRRYFGEVTKQLGTELNSLYNINDQSWFNYLENSANKVGLLWVVTEKINKDGFWGRDEDIELVVDLEQSGNWKRKGKNLVGSTSRFDLAAIYDDKVSMQKIISQAQDTKVRHLKEEYLKQKQFIEGAYKGKEGITRRVIRITLPSDYRIWLGVEQPNFDLELDYYSPWQMFLERFAEIAESGLRRIIIMDRQEKVQEWAKYQGLATAAAATGTVVHQLVNLLREIEGSVTVLKRAVERGSLGSKKSHSELVLLLGDSINQVEKISGLVFGVIKTDTHRPCLLKDAIDFAKSLLEISLNSNNIQVDDLRIEPECVLDVPFNVAAFTIANLLDNAKDAIKSTGRGAGIIWIFSEENKDMFLCHIKDSGPGVPIELMDYLFNEPGVTSKSNGSGVGLYLSAHALRENRGKVALTNPGPKPPTTFTIYFPKIRTGRA